MFEGRDPTTGEPLGRPHGRIAMPVFDVVLRPTKSVSILYGLGDPATGRAVLAAHHAGLAEAVAYLDDHPVGICQVSGAVPADAQQSGAVTSARISAASSTLARAQVRSHCSCGGAATIWSCPSKQRRSRSCARRA
jgi:hypothetical protein